MGHLRRACVVFALLIVTGAGLAADEGITIGGRVLVPGGDPLPEAEVQLLPLTDEVSAARALFAEEPIEPLALTRTDEDGRFRIDAPGAGLWRVRVSAPGFVPLEAHLQPLIEPVVLSDARLLSDAGVKVSVTDKAGEPLAGAHVLGRRDEGSARFFREVWRTPLRGGVTAADGTLRLARGEREPLSISASKPGKSFRELRGRLGAKAKLVLNDGAAIPLKVLGDDGTPAPGVQIAQGKRPHPIAVTDEQGLARITAAAGSSVELTLSADDGRSLDTRIESKSEASEAARELSLPAWTAVVGKLIDAETRRPIGSGLVWDSERPVDGVIADGSGGFALGGPQGQRMRIVSGAPGYLKGDEFEFQLNDDGRPGPTLALKPAAAIEGRVLDAAGNAVAGAELKIAEKRNPNAMRIEIGAPVELPRSISDSHGAFRLSPVDPEKRYTLTAKADGFAPGEQTVGGLEPYRTRKGVDVELVQGQTIVGLVIDGDGHAVREAQVSVKPHRPPKGMGMMRIMDAGDDGAPATATSDGNGAFELEGLPPGKFDVEVRRAGYAKRIVPAVELMADGDAVDLGEILLEVGERVQGVATNSNGKPLEGVEVFVRESAGPMMVMMAGLPGDEVAEEPDAVTDPSGWFAVGDLAGGESYSLDFSRSGYVSNQAKAISPPRTEPVEVVLQPSSLVSGLVLDVNAEPVPGAQVSLARRQTIEMGGSVMMTMMMESTNSDADGRFAFEDQAPGKIALSAVASGFQETERKGLEIPEGEDLDNVELKLPSGAILQGRVLGADGRPVIGASVREIDDSEGPMRFGGAATDGNGVYRIEGLAPGAISVEATHNDFPRTVRDAELSEGINDLDLNFEGGHEVSGQVLDAAGNGLPGAAVRLAKQGRPWGGQQVQSTTSGLFQLPGVRDGDYELWVEAEGFAPAAGEQKVQVTGGPIAGLEVRLDGGATIAGTISGIAPERFGELSVRAVGSGFGDLGGAGVDQEGGYELENLAPGTYTVEARVSESGRTARDSITLEIGQTEVRLDLEFDAGIVLSGRAVEGQEPVVGATVFVEGIDINRSGWSQTDIGGKFEIEGLEPGSYEVRLRNFQTGLKHDEQIELATSREIEIEVPTARVFGLVVDSGDGQPLAGVTLTMNRSEDDSPGFMPARSATSDADGAFEVENIADGSWQLTANKKGYAAVNRTLQVQFGKVAEQLKLTMDPTEGMVLEARLPSGVAPEEIRAAVIDGAGQPVVFGHYATGENGRVRLSSVPPGSWGIVVSAAGSATMNLRADAPGTTVPVALQPACSLSLAVPELEGSEEIVTVRLSTADGTPFRTLGWNGRPLSEWRMTGGRMELATLPPGQWKVTVAAADGRSWEGGASTSPGGSTELKLE